MVNFFEMFWASAYQRRKPWQGRYESNILAYFILSLSRGNEHKDIFKTQKDREQFLSYVESAGVRYGAVVHAWCLMRNHYHLLLETPSGNLSQIMRHINGAYTTYVNGKRKRAGHLFRGAQLKERGECFGIRNAAVCQA